ncbi:gliding motility protein GldM [Olivibacter sitiensis]|uniref:type IX secretion system motor protein PorM/GldM n=1 Tax=Olivibacter sitiensis TaxID=376470 RepID=UPI00042204A5|nr:gliding motility protein GldM [Olivibacter sitiensis]
MAGGKETTRQKMINIMYLVLLAMLALNVSDTILEAFKTINDSLETSTSNVSTSVEQLFTSFEQTKLKDNPERAKPIYEKAKQASQLAGELNSMIEELKQRFINDGGGINEETGDIKMRDNTDIAQSIMINGKKATELKNKINETREKLIEILGPKDAELATFSLEANDPKKAVGTKRSWEQVNFGEGVPLTAAMTILSKIQADAKNAESDVVKRILGQMDQAVVTLDQFEAVAVAPTSYLIQGQPYEAEVFLTAYDSKSNPTVTVGGSALPTKDGRGLYTVSTSKEGTFTWKANILVKGTDGTDKTYTTKEQSYTVARPSAVVSPDKMNVFYIGVDNPVSVSAPGIPADKIKVSMSGGTISGSNGKYNVRATTPGTAKVSITAEVAPGKSQTLSTTEFRVKRIPDPIAKFAGKSGGSMPTVAIKAQSALFATLENFEFDAKFNITKFSLIIANPRADAIVLSANNNQLSPAMKNALNGISPGARVIFDQIIAVGPDGSPRQLAPVALTAN